MMRLRPILRDDMPATGMPVVAERRGACIGAPSRAPVVHSYAALALYTDGHARMEQRGEWTLTAGDVLIVPPGEPHRRLDARHSAYWGLSFCAPCFAADGAATLLTPFERVRDGAAPVVRIPGERQQFLLELLRELEGMTEQTRQGDAQESVRRSLLTLILNEVDRARSQPEVRAVPGKSVVVDSLRFIERHCLGRLTLGDVAAAVQRSPAYVTSALSQATGRSAVEWIISCRMAEARRLLVSSDELVEVIAERVGYADSTHFIRLFRRQHGATPTAWRAQRLTRR
jgi:AraC family transcriptional regulator, transcriptional activator of pobA